MRVVLTHPRVLYPLLFLLSAVAKRDPVGRKPKKGVFAREGLAALARDGFGGCEEVARADGDEKCAEVGGTITGKEKEKEIMRMFFFYF